MRKMPRIIIAGVSSGSGKTTTVCGLLGILKKLNKNPASFKCGPDYIDPMFHSKILGVDSNNLDLFFHDKKSINSQIAYCGASIAVIEGVMGFYDGVRIDSEKGSTHDLSLITNTPVILVINCKGMASSILATIKGFYTYRENNVKGVILNNITKHTYIEIKKLIEQEFSNKISVLGYIAKLPSNLTLESRHLGLKTADEISDIKEKLMSLSDVLSETLDIEGIIKLAQSADDINCEEVKISKICGDVNIAVAYDNAFCFYYKHTINLLQSLGANIKYFSPLKDKTLPENIDGVYFGGGYPELYKTELAQNISMKSSVENALVNRLPCIAECGGFMYLTEKIEGENMVGFIKGECLNKNKLVRFGYVSLTAQKDNMLCKKGKEMKCHEFHYYDSTNNGESFIAQKLNGTTWDAVHTNDRLYAGFPHIAFNQDIASAFIEKCMEYKSERKGKIC